MATHRVHRDAIRDDANRPEHPRRYILGLQQNHTIRTRIIFQHYAVLALLPGGRRELFTAE